MLAKSNSKTFAYLLLAGSIIGGVGGALLLGHILHEAARIIFELSDESFTTLILPIVILTVAGIVGTVILVLSFKIENKVIKFTTIAFSVLIPSIIEVIDLSIRALLFFNEYTASLY